MMKIRIQDEQGGITEMIHANGRCTIGGGSQNDIVLKGMLVAREHAVLRKEKAGIVVSDLGSMMGIRVNGERVQEYGPLEVTDKLSIGRYVLRVDAFLENALVVNKPEIDANASCRSIDFPSSAEQKKMAMQHKIDNKIAPRDEEISVEWRKKAHEKLIAQLDLRRRDVSQMSDEALRRETELIIRHIMEKSQDIPVNVDRDKLVNEVINEAIGLGPIETLLADETITEIMVNRHDEVFVERAGRLSRHPISFTNEQTLMRIIERVVAPLGRRIDESSPMVDARLKDGSRVNAVIPPLALKGPSITIRKFSKRRYVCEDLIEFGSLTKPMADFLQMCVEQRKNIVIAGGTGSGKTTLLNVISNFIPPTERILTIEDSAELQLHQENLVSLEARPANLEGRGVVSIRDLVKNSLRMRPDRIVIGECRGGEALDMLQAMNTGHDGSLTTVHANTPRDVLSRLEVMVLMAGMDLPITAIREQVASAVDIIVQQTRFACGSRKITHITEITGVEAGKIQLQDIFLFRQKGIGKDGKVSGYFTACDFIPTFYEDLKSMEVAADFSIFRASEEGA
ncbi:MAG: ATPase, T2SS/T4P/T4SS family [Pseudomonadota bacterium]